MTCREFTDFLESYFSGELPPDRRAIFERHLSLCENCGIYLQTYEQTIRLGKEAFADPDGDVAGVPDELVRAVLQARKAR